MLAMAGPMRMDSPRTPKKRKKRPSISPRKRSSHLRLSDPVGTASPSVVQNEPDVNAEPCLPDPLKDISLWDQANTTYHDPTSTEKAVLLQRLRMLYEGVAAFSVMFPWMIIEIEEPHEVPPPQTTPFFIAGLVAVFIREGSPLPAGVGNFGIRGEGEPVRLPQSIEQDLRPYHIPKFSTFEYLHKAIPDAEHVSSYPRQLLFEMYPMTEEEFLKRLQSLPRRFGKLVACYYNGEHLKDSYARLKTPNPQLVDKHGEHQSDDTEYLDPKNGGILRPGCLVECIGQIKDGKLIGAMASNSGILITKDNIQRLTVASHTWDGVDEERRIVYHGTHAVGRLKEVLGEDIGLVETNVPFNNTFLSYDVHAKRFIHSDHITMDDRICVDSCYTGPQMLQCHGSRTGKRKRRGSGPSGDCIYIIIEQGIYATNCTFIPHPPYIREGMCGTPLLRMENTLDSSVSPERGEICGFFLWCNIKGYDEGGTVYAYSQPTDPLIEAGWSIAAIDDIT